MNYSIRHVLVMRLLMQYPLKTAQTVHNIFFMVSAFETIRYELLFYDFIRLNYGPYSPRLQTVIDELIVNQLLSKKDYELTPQGREIYYSLATTLLGFRDLVDKFTTIIANHSNNIAQINKSIKTNFVLRKAGLGSKIF